VGNLSNFLAGALAGTEHAHDLISDPVRFLFVRIAGLTDFEFGLN
jgi:hypothetical protein